MGKNDSISFTLPDGRVVDFDRLVEGTHSGVNGIRLTSLAEGTAEGTITIAAGQLNARGNLHGGVAATLADAITGVGCMFLYQTTKLATAGLNIVYLRPVREGTITATCHALSKGRALSVWKAELTDEEGTLFAEATVTYALLEQMG